MRSNVTPLLLTVCLFSTLASAGPRTGAGGAAAGALYERLICIVPIVGAGTLDDPKRPLFTPASTTASQAQSSARPSKGFTEPPAITAFYSIPADDGQTAIVEFVARDRAAFKEILASDNPAVRVFDPHKTPTAAILNQLRQFKESFDFSAFGESGL